jgi:hypothetical protein
MALATTIINATDKLSVLRTKFNSLLSEFNDFTFDINGNLQFTGNISQSDEKLTLNYGETQSGSLTKLPGLEIDRGLLTDQTLVWNESTGTWQVGELAGSLTSISLNGHVHSDYLNKDGSVSMTGNLELGNHYIGNDGGNEGLSFDTSGNGTFSGSLTSNSLITGTTQVTSLETRNSTNPTTVLIDNTYTDGSNYERAFLKFDSNVFEIGTEALGTGTKREVGINTNGLIKIYTYNGNLSDDATLTLPTYTKFMKGFVLIGDNTEHTDFIGNISGSVTLINNSANVVANADTDVKLCIGTGTANPIVLKNRLGSSKDMFVIIWYY